MDLPLGPWEPDAGPYSGTSLDKVTNAVPRTNGWGPCPSLSPISSSLGSDVLAAWYGRNSEGVYRVIAATRTGVFLFNSGTGGWTDITGTSTPNVPDGWRPTATTFGPLFIIAGLGTAIQKFDLETGTVCEDLGGSPPQAKFVATVGDFVVLAYLASGATEYPRKVVWSGINDAEHWTEGEKNSDHQTLPDGDEINGLFPFVGGARIIQRNMKRAMTFSGGPFVFHIQVIDPTRGAIAPYAIVPISANDYVFLREDGFYRGDENAPIGAKRVDGYFLADLDLDQIDQVQGIVDPFNKAVMWSYVSTSGARRMICYEWELNRWFRLDVATMLLIASVAPGVTLEGLDVYGSLESVPYSLDSRVWRGGRPTVGAFLPDGRMALFSGGSLAATLETATTELIPGSRAFVTGARFVAANADDYQITVGATPLHGQQVSFGPNATFSARSGRVPLRSDGRLHRFRVTVGADSGWTHAHAVRAEFSPSGML